MTPFALYTRAKLERIREAISEEDWFTAIVLSATELERFGCEAIHDYLKNKEVKKELCHRWLESLYLKDVADYLLILGIIDKTEKSTIMEINTHRNLFIHRREKKKALMGKEARAKYEPLSNEAIRILKERLNVVKGFVTR